MTCWHEWDSIPIDNYRSYFCTKCEKTETEEYCDGWDDAITLANTTIDAKDAATIAAKDKEIERLRAELGMLKMGFTPVPDAESKGKTCP